MYRAGDAEREQAAEKLRIAAGEGRIDLAELEERLERAYRAKTHDELDALLTDLPDGAARRSARRSRAGDDVAHDPRE